MESRSLIIDTRIVHGVKKILTSHQITSITSTAHIFNPARIQIRCYLSWKTPLCCSDGQATFTFHLQSQTWLVDGRALTGSERCTFHSGFVLSNINNDKSVFNVWRFQIVRFVLLHHLGCVGRWNGLWACLFMCHHSSSRGCSPSQGTVISYYHSGILLFVTNCSGVGASILSTELSLITVLWYCTLA